MFGKLPWVTQPVNGRVEIFIQEIRDSKDQGLLHGVSRKNSLCYRKTLGRILAGLLVDLMGPGVRTNFQSLLITSSSLMGILLCIFKNFNDN